MSYILAATGLRREARIIARSGIVAVACGGHGAVLEAALEARIAGARPLGVMSIGIAGALDPKLRVGDVVTGPFSPGHAKWHVSRPLPQGEREALPSPVEGEGDSRRLPRRGEGVLGVDLAVATAAAKATVRAATGAAAVDMESHVAAAVAARHDLPFAILRVVSDTAAHDLPPAAGIPLRPDGKVDLPRVLAALARRPGQLPALLTLARDTDIALRKLAALLRRFDGLTLDRLLRLDLGELGLDVLREHELGRPGVG